MRLLLIVLVSLVTLAACSDVRSYETRGRVISLGEDGRSVVVDHEDIPNLMPAMTMRLRALDASELRDVAAGDAIAFRLNLNSDSTWIDRVAVLEPDAVEGRPSQPAIHENDGLTMAMPGEQVPSFSLIDQDGSEVSADDLRGRPYLATFIYTRCPLPDYCPLMSTRFQEIQRRLAIDDRDVMLVSISIDPEYDTSTVMAEYGSRLTDDTSTWLFATGNPAQISRVATIFGVFYSEDNGEINHNLSTVLVGSDGRVRSIWRGNEWTVDEVVQTIERVVDVEANRRP